jgi:hypothetical protein
MLAKPGHSMPQVKKWRFRIVGVLSLGLWGVLLLGGIGWLWAYDALPGAQRPAPRKWPVDSRIGLVGGRYNLVVFVHEGCPCSRATIGELARIMARRGDRIAARVLVTRYPGVSDEGGTAGLFEAAAAIPGVVAEMDDGGVEARRFGAASSGQVLVYGPGAGLAFSGGITASRGHFGDNDGEAAVLALVNGEKPAFDRTAVYGCALFSDSTTQPTERREECRK